MNPGVRRKQEREREREKLEGEREKLEKEREVGERKEGENRMSCSLDPIVSFSHRFTTSSPSLRHFQCATSFNKFTLFSLAFFSLIVSPSVSLSTLSLSLCPRFCFQFPCTNSSLEGEQYCQIMYPDLEPSIYFHI